MQATMPYGVKTLVFLLAGMLVAIARAQDYYDEYLEPQVMTITFHHIKTINPYYFLATCCCLCGSGTSGRGQ